MEIADESARPESIGLYVIVEDVVGKVIQVPKVEADGIAHREERQEDERRVGPRSNANDKNGNVCQGANKCQTQLVASDYVRDSQSHDLKSHPNKCDLSDERLKFFFFIESEDVVLIEKWLLLNYSIDD